jgi:hypothetical protein
MIWAKVKRGTEFIEEALKIEIMFLSDTSGQLYKSISKRLEDKKDPPSYRELIVMKIKLKIFSVLQILVEEKEGCEIHQLELVRSSLAKIPSFGPDYLLQANREFLGSRLSPDEMVDFKILCFSKSSWELRDGAVKFVRFE